MKDIENLAVKKLLILAAVVLLSALAVVNLNHISKTRLVNRTGQSFETGVVVRILEDNIQEDGMRVGQQTVVVRMTSGEKKGQELITTSSAGYLFGAACTVGMRVVVIQSIAGRFCDHKRIFQGQDSRNDWFCSLYLAILCIVGGKKGLRGALGLVFTFGAIVYVYLPAVLSGENFTGFGTVCFYSAAVTTLVTMYLIGGAGEKTLCATVGTLSGVILQASQLLFFHSFPELPDGMYQT